MERIVGVKREEVRALRRNYSHARFAASALFHRPTISMQAALRSPDSIALIAEIKKASPSKGLIRTNFDHLEIASTYTNAGVEAISVLTDRTFFRGNIRYLEEISQSRQVPLLRKEFIIDEYQVLEARANGADAVLLIAEILSKSQIEELTHAVVELTMEVLLELHSPSQLDKIDFNRNPLIGINNRNLNDFSVDLSTTLTIAEQLPDHVLPVSESGIQTEADLQVLKSSRVQAVLVGEHLMQSSDINAAVHELQGWCRREG